MWAILLASQLIVNDDRDVIQTAMLGYFNHEDWYMADWKPKNHVVLRTQLRSKERGNYEKTRQGLIDGMRTYFEMYEGMIRDGKIKKEKMPSYEKEIKRLKETAAHFEAANGQGDGFVAPDLVPLKTMTWDRRIKVTDSDNRAMSFKRNDKSLEEWTVYVTTARPVYSGDGKYAILQTHLPWSMHGADVDFLFERTDAGWKRLTVYPRIYV